MHADRSLAVASKKFGCQIISRFVATVCTRVAEEVRLVQLTRYVTEQMMKIVLSS